MRRRHHSLVSQVKKVKLELEKTLMLGKTEGKRRIRWLDTIMDSMDMNLNKLLEIVEDGGAWGTAVHGVTKSQILLSN